MPLPAPYLRLLQAFDALPGVGPQAAGRLTQFILMGNQNGQGNNAHGNDAGSELAQAILAAGETLVMCERCYRYAMQSVCDDCAGHEQGGTLWVVENTEARLSAENRGWRQLFVLHGLLSPVAGIGPAQLHLPQLRQRVAAEGVAELKLLLSQGVEADVTTQFIQDLLADLPVTVERLQEEPEYGTA